MSWAFNASGVTGDIEMVKKLIGEIRDVLAKPEYGTGTSQVSSPLGLTNNFHAEEVTAAPAEPDQQAPAGSDGVDQAGSPPKATD